MPNVEYLKPFGFPCTTLHTKEHVSKMEQKAVGCFFLGYSANSPHKRVFNRVAGVIEPSYHVDYAHTYPPTRKGSYRGFDYKHLYESLNVFPDVSTTDLETIIRSREDDATFSRRLVVSPTSRESATIKTKTDNPQIQW